MISPSRMLISSIQCFSPVVFSEIPALSRYTRMATRTASQGEHCPRCTRSSGSRTFAPVHRHNIATWERLSIFTQHHNLILHFKCYSYTALWSYPVNHFIRNNNTKYILNKYCRLAGWLVVKVLIGAVIDGVPCVSLPVTVGSGALGVPWGK